MCVQRVVCCVCVCRVCVCAHAYACACTVLSDCVRRLTHTVFLLNRISWTRFPYPLPLCYSMATHRIEIHDDLFSDRFLRPAYRRRSREEMMYNQLAASLAAYRKGELTRVRSVHTHTLTTHTHTHTHTPTSDLLRTFRGRHETRRYANTHSRAHSHTYTHNTRCLRCLRR